VETLMEINRKSVIDRTVGKDFMTEIKDEDKPKVYQFLKVVDNYRRLNEIADKNKK
jgi:hypothetical protein